MQLVASEKSDEPEMLPPLKVTASPDFLLEALVSLTFFCLCVPIFFLPKLREVWFSLTMAEEVSGASRYAVTNLAISTVPHPVARS